MLQPVLALTRSRPASRRGSRPRCCRRPRREDAICVERAPFAVRADPKMSPRDRQRSADPFRRSHRSGQSGGRARLRGQRMSRTATSRRGNLPSELTSFIGRRQQLQDVKAALTRARMVTLVGPGGVGKTRLALRAAADLARGIPDGVWLVELDSVRDPELVTKAVMTSLGLRDELSGWPVSRLIEYLTPRQLLLVLDNCEHLIDACAVLADAVLHQASNVRILATSRQPLGVAGENVIQVHPLSVPDDEDELTPERIAQSDAVALLLERAMEAGAAFEVTADNRAVVTELARRLDGIPLAIELAAVRLRTLGLEQLIERLNDRFHLL